MKTCNFYVCCLKPPVGTDPYAIAWTFQIKQWSCHLQQRAFYNAMRIDWPHSAFVDL